jgi:DNA polymerase III subunit alpha
MSFVHLHNHTEFSMLDGAARVGDAVAAAKADGQPALAITDHGNMYGVLDFYKACRSADITPIIGTEAYMAHESRAERPARRGRLDDSGGDTEGGRKLYYHLTLLAQDRTGYRNMIQLASRAFLEGYFYKPRIDWELLDEHSDGLIATTACLGGHVLQALLMGDEAEALTRAGRLQDIFGKDNLFIEIQDHGIDKQRQTMPGLLEISRKLGAPLLATNDSHYVAREDAKAHDALLCVQTNSMMSDPTRFKFEGEEHYLKSADEMRRLFPDADYPGACDNTLLIAERCNVEIEFGKPLLPQFPLPEGFADDRAYLQQLTLDGAKARWGQLTDEILDRVNFELQVIADMGFSSYFLIVWDLIKHARDKGIRVGPGRGSAAGCCVAYCLRITDLDPIKYDLLFERFLNPSRISMPDIDMDFDSRYRDEMIRYAAERYGRDRVAQIVTFSTIKARAAVRDAARVLGYPYAVGDKVAKLMPPLIMGRDTPLHACLEKTEKFEEGYKMAGELRTIYESDSDARAVIDVATGLENLRRQDSIHAAAVVITDQPVTEYAPVQRKPESGQAPEEAPIVTQYEMNGIESLGLLKMDFLGLRNLDVIEDALELIQAVRGEVVDIDNVPLDDDLTLAMLRRGESIGVFQLEGGPMRALMRSLAPTSFDDIAALVALYRPGPMGANMHNDYADRKNGRKPVEYLHPDLEETLGDTYGLMIYQESVMRVAQKVAGYSLAEADNLRKACGKKIREMIRAERDKFVAGCETTGYGRDLGDRLFDIIEPFADYAFNKSHAYGYGLIAYQTAWLKAHYPVEYLAALLTSVKDSQDKAAIYLAECRSMGIEVRVPDINLSVSKFTAVPPEDVEAGTLGSIPFGLSAVRNVGEGVTDLILEEREAAGPFTDFYDFCERVDTAALNKRTVEALIKSGAFDLLGHTRKGLLAAYERIIDLTVAKRKQHDMGAMSLFDSIDDGPVFDDRPRIDEDELDKKVKLAFEKEMLGLYISDHPLMGVESSLRRRTDGTVDEILGGEEETVCSLGGVVTSLQRKWTKRGDLMAVFQLEDLRGAIEVMVFPKTMTEHGHKLEDDAIVIVRGRVDRKEDTARVMAMELERFEPVADSPSVTIDLTRSAVNDDLLRRLKGVLSDHPGESEVVLQLSERQRVRLADDLSVDASNGLVAELRVLLGSNAVSV